MRLFFALSAALLFAPSALAQTYRVGPGDLLEINVLEITDWKNDYRVDVEGKLLLPLLGELNVKDKTLIEIRNEIKQQLKDKKFVIAPQVFVDIKEVIYKPIRVIGQVKRPGKLETISPNMTLLSALAEVGGLLETAGDTVTILREGPEGPEDLLATRVSFSELSLNGVGNPQLKPGDIISVPKAMPLVVSILGEVNRQGELIFSSDQEVTLLRVLARAGGFTDYARKSRVIIRRKGQTDDIRVDVKAIQDGKEPDVAIQNDDILIVP